ncbi:MAG: fatty acid CoA ligase family protein [Pirellulaceae bacterium]
MSENSLDLSSLKNIADSLRVAAAVCPGQVAIAEPASVSRSGKISYRTITFRELESKVNSIANALAEHQIGQGDRISLMIPPGIDFVTWVFALFRSRATVILIDPGMGKKNMVRCLAEANPDGLVGIFAAQVIRTVLKRRFPNCRKNFTVGRRPLPLGKSTLAFGDQPDTVSIANDDATQEDEAAIIFTTGSTGPPKGVLYRHRNFIQQTIQIRDYFRIQPGGADVSGFPLFALFNTGMGMTTIFPKMDPTRPAKIHPPFFLDAVKQFQANQSFGSPALWNTVSRYCEQNNVQVSGLKRVLTAGAPVPEHVIKRVRACIDSDGEVHTPYGATESLPVACIESREIIDGTWKETVKGAGICVGRRWPQIEWRLIEINDGPIEDIADTCEVPQGTIGEIMVRGPVVTERYVTRDDANRLHKVRDGESIWHRIGDVGYLDASDRFWFCGRKGHRVITADGPMFTIPCEAIFNTHPAVYRSALVGVGNAGSQRPIVVVEPWSEQWPKKKADQDSLIRSLLGIAQANTLTQSIQTILLRKSLPVDIRHNSKIFREQLAVWAAEQTGKR